MWVLIARIHIYDEAKSVKQINSLSLRYLKLARLPIPPHLHLYWISYFYSGEISRNGPYHKLLRDIATTDNVYILSQQGGFVKCFFEKN